jgi:hypothetical protein
MYSMNMYWVAQALEPNWTGDVDQSSPIDGYTEEDLLTTSL